MSPSSPILSPSKEQLDAILSVRKGSLEDVSYPLLLLALAVREKSAILTLRRNQLQKEILFDQGAPVECRSNIVTETLGRFLVAAGKLTEEQEHSAFSQSTAEGVPLGEVLVQRQLLTPSELFRMLQQNLGRKLLEPFSWKSGSYEISYDVPPVESPLRVKVPQLLVTGIMKVETQETADEAVELARGKFLSAAPNPHFDTDDFRPTSDQRKVLEAARQAARFEEVQSSSGIDEDDLSRILYALMLLGALTVTDAPIPAEVPATPDQTLQPEAPLAVPFMLDEPAAPPGVAPASPEEVMAAYLGHKRKDAFDLLGLAESDGLLRAKEAFLAVAERFHPSRFDQGAPEGIRDKAQEVLLSAARAYAELADDRRREALLKHRQRKREEASAPKPLPKSKMIDPRALCRNGRDLAVLGKYREALSYFEMAAECDAQNGEYAAEAIWCRFQLGTTPASSALTMLRHALRRDPQSGVTHLYLGKVQAVLGNRVEAAAYIDRAARLLPGDDRPAQALKGLR